MCNTIFTRLAPNFVIPSEYGFLLIYVPGSPPSLTPPPITCHQEIYLPAVGADELLVLNLRGENPFCKNSCKFADHFVPVQSDTQVVSVLVSVALIHLTLPIGSIGSVKGTLPNTF